MKSIFFSFVGSDTSTFKVEPLFTLFTFNHSRCFSYMRFILQNSLGHTSRLIVVDAVSMVTGLIMESELMFNDIVVVLEIRKGNTMN